MAPAGRMVGVVVGLVLTAALLTSGGRAAAAEQQEEEEARGMPRWAEPRLRRLLGTRRHHQVDAVVSNGGSGGGKHKHYATIGQALAAAPQHPAAGRRRYVIHVRAGTYAEVVVIRQSNVTLIGDGMGRTIIVGNRSNKTGHDTNNSAIVRKCASHL
jgi:pectinesterase